MTDNAQVEQESVDRRESLAAAFDAMEDAPEQVVDTPEAPEPTDGRVRGPDGKFAKADQAAKSSPSGVDQPEAPAEAPEPPAWHRPPASWKKEMHEHWLTAPEQLKQYAFQREQEMSAGVQPLKEKAQLADSILKIAEPYQPTMRALGHDIPTVVQAFFNADHTLRNGNQDQKLGLLVKLAQDYGVDLSPLTGVEIAPPNPDVTAIKQALMNLQGEVKTRWQQEEERQNKVILSEIEQFAQKHEHFERLKPTMQALLQSGQADGLESAYTKAIRLDDELFESEVKARQAAEAKTKDEKAKAARAAAVSVRGSTPGSNTAPKAQGRRATLEEAFSNVESRV